MENCSLCPRQCHADRAHGQKGYCQTPAELTVARAALHMWEEPCISGHNGSGTVFFSGCTLGCVYCQNYLISQGLSGKKITIERLGEIFIALQEQGAHNINLVTPSHYTPQILDALRLAQKKGLNLPIVYNCSGYEKIVTLQMLTGYIDVYLPDFKYYSEIIAQKYSRAKNYFAYASQAVKEMLRQTGTPVYSEQGLLIKGVLIRHLTLPGYLQDSKSIIKFLHYNFKNSVLLSIMSQYTPLAVNLTSYPELNKTVTKQDYEELIDYAIAIGVENAYIQSGETASESFIPEFDLTGI